MREPACFSHPREQPAVWWTLAQQLVVHFKVRVDLVYAYQPVLWVRSHILSVPRERAHLLVVCVELIVCTDFRTGIACGSWRCLLNLRDPWSKTKSKKYVISCAYRCLAEGPKEGEGEGGEQKEARAESGDSSRNDSDKETRTHTTQRESGWPVGQVKDNEHTTGYNSRYAGVFFLRRTQAASMPPRAAVEGRQNLCTLHTLQNGGRI